MSIVDQLSESQAIESMLVDLVHPKEFAPRGYLKDLDGDTVEDNPDLMKSVVDYTNTVTPNSTRVFELDVSYGEDPNRMVWPPRRRVTQWLWQVEARFTQKVDVSLAAADFAKNPPVLVRDEANRIGQYVLNLQRVRQHYEPRASAERGTVVTFTFRATPARN